jgi:hypothetical protein
VRRENPIGPAILPPWNALPSIGAQWKNRPFFTIHGRLEGAALALRAVLFDYGMVLSVQPPAEAHAALLRLSGLSEEKLDSLYWANRPAYDLGTLTGEGFWRKLAQDAAISLPPSTIDELDGRKFGHDRLAACS